MQARGKRLYPHRDILLTLASDASLVPRDKGDDVGGHAQGVAGEQIPGLVAGAFAGTPDFCRAYAALGFRFMAGPTDTDLLNRGAEAFLKATAPN